jgi:hypothetical protein
MSNQPVPAFYYWVEDNLENIKNLLGKNSCKKDIVDTLLFIWTRLDKNTKDLYLVREKELLRIYKEQRVEQRVNVSKL